MLKVRSRVADVPGVVWVLNRSLFIVAIMLALLVSAGVAYAQGTPTVPTIESVAVTSDPGEDGGYAIGDEIQVGLTFSEAVTVTGAPQLTLDVGGRNRTSEYSEGSTTTQLLFTYTVLSGDEDTDGIAVVANSLALNGGAIRAGSTNATLTHADLQAEDHKVDGIAPTVTVGGETRIYVPPGRQFNVVFYFSEKVYGITTAEITVTNGQAHDVQATGGNDTWPKYTRWDVIIQPATEGPVTVTLEAGAGADAYGNGNTAPDSALEVIAANPVTVEVARTTSGFAEGGRAEFTVTRSRDNGAISVFLSLDQTGDLLSGSVEVYPPADPNNPSEPVTPQEFTFTETPFNLNVTFAAGETSKRIAVPTEDDYRDEEDGTVTLSVPARTDQYKYIPGHASSPTADVRDNDVPVTVSLYWIRSFHPYTHSNLDTALEGGSISLVVYGRATGQPLQVTLAVTEVGSYLDLDGDGAWGYENLGNGKLLVTLPVDLSFQNVVIPLVENDVREADGSVTITIEPDPERSYTPSVQFDELTVPVKDNDTPSTVSISAPDSITEGGPLSYTLTRTWAPGQSQGELSVNVELAQTGDYITWPTAHQPDADGLVTIPVNFAGRSLTATLTLETVDDQMSEDNGSVTATILADADGSYVTGAGSGHTTQLMDNDPPIISVSAVSAEVTEGTDAQFRFSRSGNTGVATRVGLYVGGLPKIMTDATEATVLASQENTVRIYGASVDYILEFAAGEAEKTLSFTTEADNVNEGDGWLGVRIVQRVANPFSIGTGYAQALVKDDDIPTVSLTRPVGPTGLTLSADGTTWEGQIVEGGEFTYSSVCTGVTEFSEDQRNNLVPLSMSVLYSDHPAFYGEEAQDRLGNNQAGVRSVGADCVSATVTNGVRNLFVGPENGVLEIELLPQSELVVKGSPSGAVHPKVFAEFITKYEDAATAAQAAGTLITQKGLFHPIQLGYYYRAFACNETDDRYCPKYLVGTVNKIHLTVMNRDPVVLIKAENSEVEEGQPARFVVERMWSKDLLALQAPHSTTVVSLRASQNGQYITGALPAEIAFGQNETRKVIELQTVDDGAFGDDGSVTIELLPDTTGDGVNLQGKYTTWEIWQGHTPEGGRSDRATVTITNNDDKPGITIAPASALEGDSGSADMTFTVTLAKAVTEAVTVNYATSDGTAIAGRDYTAVSNGSVTIAAGNTTAEFTVSMTGDETDELDETFNVTISMPEPEPNLNGGSSGEPVAAITGGDTAAAVGTILDDDPAVVTVAPKKSPVTEGEEVVFVLTRTGVTDEELYMLVDLEDPARRRLMIAKFDADAVTTELSVATENNDLVDYPSERDYTIHLYGDGYFGDRDDERYTPGDPDEATVTVQDNDALVVVTVEPVKEVVGAGESVQFRFRRTGSIAGALTISFQGFEHPSSGDATLADASVTFLADNDTVVYTNDVTSSGTVNPISRAHTVLIYGDAGRGGLHRSWIAGDPNRATVVVAVDALGPMPVTASYPSRVAAAESVSVEYTVTNLGTRALLGYENRVSDGTRISTTPDRGNCDIRDEIPAGESRTCSASFTVTNQDVTNGKIEFNATARNFRKSSTLRVYIRVAQPVEFGFTTADTLEVTEGPNVTATLPVTRTGRLDEAVTVAYQLRPQGIRPAALGEDFTDPSSTPGLLTFPANVTSANIVINITQDQIDEERERFRVVLVPLTDGTITEGKESRVVLVKDEHQENDPYRPTASLQLVSSGPVPENEGPVEFAIVLDRVWGREGRYEVEVLPDQTTATPGFAALGKEGDFEEPLIRILRIPAGQTRFEFSVPLYDDDVREEDETFLLQLTSPYDDSFRTIGASNRALATIADDDRILPTEVALSLSHNGSALESVPEGSTQQDITATATFPQIRWPGDASNAPLRPADPRDVDTTVRVQFDPNSGATHAAGLDDFAPLEVEDDQGAFQEVESFDIVIPAGQTSGTATLRFRPVKDDVDEEDETVTLMGSELVAGNPEDTLPVRPASFTIIDDDTRGITVSPASALVGLSLVEGGESQTYSLVLDSQPTDTVVITLAGNQGGFLRLVPDTLTFTTSDWATPQTVSVVALDDGIAGGAGSQDVIAHQVSGGDYGSVTAPDIQALVTDTTKAFVYLEGGQASESDGYVEFTVTVRPILRTTPVLVRYATVDGTAIAGSDYTRDVETGQTYKILNIPAGQSSATIRIPIIDNQVYESADETFTLQLTNHNNKATLDGDATSLTATGAIADDDPKPVVSVAGPAGEVSYVSENAKDPVTFTLTLVGQSAGDVTVDYATGEAGLLGLLTARQGLAGATEGQDYAGASGTVTFTPGQTTKTVTVQVTNDDVSEDTEFFGFKISAPQGADLRGQRSEDVADVGLLDDDPRGMAIGPTSIGLNEPVAGGTAVAGAYTVNLNSKPTDTVTVTIGGGDPAVSLSGDTLTNNQLTFTTTNWNMAQTITVTPVKDDNAAGETVTLTHTVSGGDYAGIAADSVTVNLTDSDARTLVLSEESLAVTEGDATGVGYTVKLATQPSDTVTVAISGHDGADLTLSGTTLTNNQLTFTTTNWGTAQTVTVKAGGDDNTDDESEILAHTASGGDYVNITKDLPVTVTDDGEVPVTVSFGAGTYTVLEGGEQAVTVTLSADPERTVVIPLTHTPQGSTTSADYSGVPPSVTFNTGQMSQTITFTAAQDEVDDDGERVLLAFGTLPPAVSLGTTTQATVSITDDDGAGVSVSESSLTIAEGSSGTYTIVLDSQPTATVTVTINDPSNTDVTAEPASLTFSSTDWSSPKTVTVNAAQDTDAEDETATVTHTVTSTDSIYSGALANSVAVSVTDDEVPVTVQFGATTYEVVEGETVTVAVTLSADPERTVVIPITATPQGATTTDDYTVPSSVTFSSGQTYTSFPFTATQDNLDDDGESVKLAIGTLPSRVTQGATNETTVTVTDDDTAGVTIEPTTLSVVAGRSNEYAVALATEPTGDVTVTISGHAGTDVTPDKTTLTFTTDNWDTAQTVTISATQNAATAKVTLAHAVAGADYGSVTAEPVVVSVVGVAGQQPTLQVGVSSSAQTLTVPEGGANSYTLVLGSRPTGDVTVGVTLPAGTDLTLDKTTLTFTMDNWDVAQTVAVTAAEDDDGVTDAGVRLTHTVSGEGYGSTTVPDVEVSITENDSAGIVLSETGLTVTEGSAAGSSYTVKLATQPSGSVSVSITGHAGTDLTLDKTTLTFTVDDWATAQTVTVKAGDDDNAVNESETLAHTAFGGDYVNVTKDLPVSITDDDTPAIVLSETDLTVTEGSAAGSSYTVKLATQPTGEVTVTVSGHAGTDLSLDKTTLTFTVDNWATAQTVTVKAGQDDDAANDTGTLTHTASGGDYASVSNTLLVTLTDDDEVPVTVQFGATTYEVVEGETVTVAVTLSADPERTVVVPITHSPQDGADSPADYSGVPANLTFNTGQMSQTITFTAAQDEVDDDESVLLGFGAPLPGGVSLGTTGTTTVSITDDDVAGVSVSEASLTIAEGSSGTYTIVLNSQPTATVTVTINDPSNTDVTAEPASLTFSSTDWNTPKTVTVNAAQDADAEDETATVTHTVTSTDSIYSGASANSVAVSVTDDEVPVTVQFGATTYEVVEGETVTVAVTLSADPERTVVIPITHTPQSGADSPADYTVPPSVTFNTGQMSQTITFEAIQDDVDDDGESVLLGFGAPLPGGVSLGTTGTTTVSITDDDGAGVSVSESSLTIAEGSSGTYTIVLDSQPTATVTVTINDPSNTDVTAEPASLTFSSTDWNTPKTVTVNAAQDADAEDETATVTHTVTSTDSIYSGASANSVAVSVTDDEVPVTVQFGATTYEVVEGETVTVAVTLSADPERTVVIPITHTPQSGADSPADYTVPPSVTFNTGQMSQTITFEAIQDDVDDDDESVRLSFGMTLPPAFSLGTTTQATVSITDDDGAGVSVSESSLTIAEGSSGTYTIVLDSQPTASVAVAINDPSNTNVTAEPASLTFSSTDWTTPKTVTVSAAQDADAEDETATVTHTVTSTDSSYSGASANSVAVSVTDDEVPVTVQFGATTYEVVEGETVTVAVTLSADPERTVVVPITHTPQSGADSPADYTVPPSVTSNTGQMSKTFTFTAAQDEVDDDDESVRLSFGTLPPAVSLGTTTQATVTITDDDGPQVTVMFGEATYTVAEGGTQSVTVALSADPERTVVIPLTHTPQGGATSADYSGVPANVTFNAEDTSKTFEFMATADDVDDDDESVLLGFGTPLPGGVTAGTTNQTTVTITGDCADGDIWCATATFDAQVEWEGRYDLDTGEVDNREFSYNGEDYQLWSLEMVQNGRNAGDDNHVVLPFGIPERTLFLIDFFNLNGTGNDRFEAPNDDWLDWTLHVSTVSDGETLTAALRFSEGRKLAGAWWRWSGGDIDDLRRAWKPGQLYKLRLVEDPRAQRTSQPLNPPLYLRVEGEVNTTQTWLRWLTPQTRYDRVPPVDSYKIQWKQSSGSWDAPADVSETTRGPSRQRAVSHFLDGLTPGVEYNIRVIATDSAGDSEPSNEITYTKPASAQQSLSNTPAEGEPQINGIPEVGQTLSADTTAIADADGLDNAVFQYQWLASDADIPGATSATYTVVSGDVGKAIMVRVAFTDDAGQEETLTSASTAVVTVAGLQLQSATVDGATLTLTYNEVLDTGVTLGTTPFAVSVNGSSRSLIAVGVGESNVLLLLSQAVEVGDTVTVDYTAPDSPDFIRDIRGRKAASFSGQAVTNNTASAPLTASAHDAPSSHNGQDAFTFELRFSEEPKSDFSYTTVQDHAFTVTGGSVTYVRRLEPGKNVRWEITVTPGSGADVAIALNATTDCSAQGAICTEDGGKLSGGLLLVVLGPNAPATPNTPATDAPTISGTARVGETLTADTTGISDGDGLDNATFAYQWLADNAEIDSATASSYTLVAADAGKAIKVRVSFTDDAGNDEELISAATGAVVAAPPPLNTPATGAPTITGTAEVGEPLTADTTGISDDDGLDNATFAYQWLADDAEINGANASTYTLADDDAGKTIKVRVSFTDDAGNEEQLTSAMTGAVAAAPPPPNTPATGAPTITGAAQVGETLTADTTGISDDDGLDNATFAYQWLADNAEIDSATASSYTLVAADAGKAIKVRVSFTDDAGNDEELISAATGAVVAAPPPLNTPATGAPTITGAAEVGETLTADTTGISDDDGLDNATFAYQWLADDAEINGANASTYTLADDDAGKTIKVRVSFADDAGNDEELTSSAVTGAVATVVKPPLTATIHDVPSSHNGQDAFIFELRFSEPPKPDFSYRTVWDHAFTVTGGSVTYVRRLEPGKNVRWEITVTPGSSAAVAIALNATTDCEADGAICTDDDRKLTNRLELTVNGPE